jgi:CRP-like cAMP-binding protein
MTAPATTASPQELLPRLPLFRAMDAADCAAIASHSRLQRAERGELLFRRGDPALGMYMVAFGQVKLAFIAANGVEKVVDVRGPGQSFGEAVMFLEVPHVVTAQVLADALLLYIPHEPIFERIAADPGFARRMIGGLSRQLHQLVGEIEWLSMRTGTERVIGFLLRDCAADVDDAAAAATIELPIAKGVIASRLNLTQEHFSRILHDLSEAGLIRVHGRRIEVPDMRRLREHAP